MAEKGDKLSVEDIMTAAESGDVATLKALQAVGGSLGIGIANLLNVFNPGLIVLGGGLSLASDYLLPAVYQEIEKCSLRWSRENVQIVVARFGSDAAILGGVAAVFQEALQIFGGKARANLR